MVDRYLAFRKDGEVPLLFEDDGIERRRALLVERASLISTGDFLREFEFAGR